MPSAQPIQGPFLATTPLISKFLSLSGNAGGCSCQKNPIDLRNRKQLGADGKPDAALIRQFPFPKPNEVPFPSTRSVDERTTTLDIPFSGADAQRFKSAIIFSLSDPLTTNERWRGFVATQVLGQANQFDPKARIKRLEEWQRSNLVYMPEKGEIIYDAREVVNYRHGDCDDFVSFTVAAAEAAGFVARICWIRVKGNQGTIAPWHVYAEVGIVMPDAVQWIPVDAAAPRGREGYRVASDHILEKVIVGRDEAAKFTVPNGLLIKLTTAPTEILKVEGGPLAAAGIMYVQAGDLDLYDNAAGPFVDAMKKIGKGIKKVAGKVADVGKKILKSPAFQAVASFIPGGQAIVGVASKIVNTMDSVKQKGVLAAVEAKLAASGNPKAQMASDMLRKTTAALSDVQTKAAAEANAPPGPELIAEALRVGLNPKTIKNYSADDLAELIVQRGGTLPAQSKLSSTTPIQNMAKAVTNAPQALKAVADMAKKISPENLAQVAQTAEATIKQVAQDTLIPFMKKIESLAPSIEAATLGKIKGAVAQRLNARKQQASNVGQKLFSKVADALVTGKAVVPANLHQAADNALNIDYLASIIANKLDEFFKWLEVRKGTLDYNKNLGVFTVLKDRLLRILLQRNDLVRTVAKKLGKELPTGRVNFSDVQQLITNDQIGSMAMIMLGVGTDSVQLAKYANAINALYAQTVSLKNDTEAFENQIWRR